MLVSGYDPIVGYSALWTGMFGSASAIGETLRTMIPLILAAYRWRLHFVQVYLISG